MLDVPGLPCSYSAPTLELAVHPRAWSLPVGNGIRDQDLSSRCTQCYGMLCSPQTNTCTHTHMHTHAYITLTHKPMHTHMYAYTYIMYIRHCEFTPTPPISVLPSSSPIPYACPFLDSDNTSSPNQHSDSLAQPYDTPNRGSPLCP